MEKQITIIVPTYNMEKYLHKCLDSLLIPELDEVEVLVVNDGSKDRSSEIAHSYAERFPNSFRVIDKENGNYGSCINAALPLVTGRYVKILDADDYFDTQTFSQFVKDIRNIEADAIITNYYKVNERYDIIESFSFDKDLLSEKKSYLFNDALIRHYIHMHRIAYKTSLFNEFEYFQTEHLSYTDTQWSIIPMSFCNTITYLDLFVYYYLEGREGQTMDPANFYRLCIQLLAVMSDLVKFYQINPNFHNKNYLKICFNDKLRFLYLKGIFGKDNSYRQQIIDFDIKIRSFNKEIYDNLGELFFDKHCDYKFIKKFREKSYPQTFRLPFFYRLKFHINRMLKK